MDLAKLTALSSIRLPAFIQRLQAQARVEFFRKNDTSIVKKQKERALSLTGKLPAPNKSLDVCFEIWERESAPRELLPDKTAIYEVRRFLSELAAQGICE